jgi:AAA domain, putative AbiEii toxin, Type IV TA system
MLKSLSIKNFRLFHELQIDALNRVNLIAGENDTGKTALLESLYLLFADINSFFKFPSAFRSSQNGDDFDSFWKWLFYKRSLALSMEIRAVAEKNEKYSVSLDVPTANAISDSIKLRYRTENIWEGTREIIRGSGGSGSNPPFGPTLSVFSTTPSSPGEDADYFNRVAAKRGGEKRLVELLRVVEPALQELKYLKLGAQPLVYADVGMEDLIPTTQLGQAFTRLLRLFSEILVAKLSSETLVVKSQIIILIDEIENGIHYKAMPQVWKGIAAMARQEDLQIFATTHSYECIRYAHQAFSSEPVYDLVLHRLERDDSGNVRAVTLDRESLATSFDLEWEIR